MIDPRTTETIITLIRKLDLITERKITTKQTKIRHKLTQQFGTRTRTIKINIKITNNENITTIIASLQFSKYSV